MRRTRENRRTQLKRGLRQPRSSLQLNKHPDVASHVCISRVSFVAARLVLAGGAVMRPEDVGFTHHAGGTFLNPSRDNR